MTSDDSLLDLEAPPEPRLGIYWLIEGKVDAFAQPMSEVTPVAGFRDSDLGHADTWPQVVRRHPDLRGREYFELPRGRVLFAEHEQVFRVFMPSREAARKDLVAQVLAALSLPEEQVQVHRDRHYEPPGRDPVGDRRRRRRGR